MPAWRGWKEEGVRPSYVLMAECAGHMWQWCRFQQRRQPAAQRITIIEAPRVQVHVNDTGHWFTRFDDGPRYFPEVVSACARGFSVLGNPVCLTAVQNPADGFRGAFPGFQPSRDSPSGVAGQQ